LSDVLKDILAVVAPSLRQHGYKGSGQNYRLLADRSASIVNFQKSSGGQRFYVNVGVQPLFVPNEIDILPDPKKIKEPECIFRKRLDPPSDELHGWPYTLEIADTLVERFGSLFDRWISPLMQIPGPVTEARVDDFQPEVIDPLLGARHARNFLHFARICLAMGAVDAARDFATEAIEICPPRATSLLHHLKTTLAQTDTT
jgi:hypothetical protein